MKLWSRVDTLYKSDADATEKRFIDVNDLTDKQKGSCGLRPVKQVICVRTDLDMPAGKIGAQVAHASMGALLMMMRVRRCNGVVERILTLGEDWPVNIWLDTIFTKICVGADSDEHLRSLHEQASEADLPNSLITDNGLTCFKGVHTRTCCAIGPWWSDEINKITGGLKLL